MFTHLHCIAQWIFAYVHTHVIITQIKILGGAFQPPKKASLCPFPANPPHLQEVTTNLSPWIHFACFWISYKWVHMIWVGFFLVTVFFSSTLVCDPSWTVCTCSSFYPYEVFHYRQWYLKDGYKLLPHGQLGEDIHLSMVYLEGSCSYSIGIWGFI